MQIPSVRGMFQARAGGFAGRAFGVSAAAQDFANAYAETLGGAQGQADYGLQQLSILPGPENTQAAETAGAAQASDASPASTAQQAESTAQAASAPQAAGAFRAPTAYQTYYPAYSSRSASSAPAYIPAASRASFGVSPPAAAGAPYSAAAPDLNLAGRIIAFAEQYVGTPYVWGGEDLDKGVDCSGFMQSVFAHFGIKLPRTAYRQSSLGEAVDPKDLQPGDLLFFKYSDRAPVTHVGMYIGDGKMIEAAGKGVKITKLGRNWTDDLVVAKRIL